MERQIDPFSLELVQLKSQASRRGLWRTYRKLDEACEALGRDLDPEYADGKESKKRK